MMRVSQNQYAEMLLKAIGGRTRGREILRGWSVPDDSYIIADGSGLSRYNYVSADALVRILQVLAEHPKHASFVHDASCCRARGNARTTIWLERPPKEK